MNMKRWVVSAAVLLSLAAGALHAEKPAADSLENASVDRLIERFETASPRERRQIRALLKQKLRKRRALRRQMLRRRIERRIERQRRSRRHPPR